MPQVPNTETNEDIEPDDTILTAIAKLWKKASASFTTIEAKLLFEDSQILTLTDLDNKNTYIVEGAKLISRYC